MRRYVYRSSLLVLAALATLGGSGFPRAYAQERTPVPGAPKEIVAFVNVTVVPMDSDRVVSKATVVVEHGWITAVGPSGQVQVPAGARRVEGRGKYLIPGLADMHAHFGIFNQAEREHRLFLWLAHGLTTVRIMDHCCNLTAYDLHGDGVLGLRARAARGELWSPRIFTAGFIRGQLLTRDSVQKMTSKERMQVSDRLQLPEVAEAVTRYKAAGFDFIKVHPFTLRFGAEARPPSAAVFDSLAAMAQRVGLPLEGHAIVPLARALETYRSIEHLSGYVSDRNGYSYELDERMPAESLALRVREWAVATQRAGVWNCPTLYNSFLNRVSPKNLALSRQLVKALQDAGAGLLAGSDRLEWPSLPADSGARKLTPAQRMGRMRHGAPGATHRELQALVEAGLTPYQALATSTRNVAAFYGTLDSAGTVAVGKRADLVLLTGNPLADIRQTEHIAGVMLGGRWLDRAELDRRSRGIAELHGDQAP